MELSRSWGGQSTRRSRGCSPFESQDRDSCWVGMGPLGPSPPPHTPSHHYRPTMAMQPPLGVISGVCLKWREDRGGSPSDIGCLHGDQLQGVLALRVHGSTQPFQRAGDVTTLQSSTRVWGLAPCYQNPQPRMSNTHSPFLSPPCC